MSDFENVFAFKKSRFGSFYSLKTTYLAFFVLFKKHDFALKISLRVRFWIEKKQRVKIWIEKNTTHQILKWKKYNASDFVLTFFRLVRFS